VIAGVFMDESIDLAGCDSRLDMWANEVEQLGIKLPGRSHRFAVLFIELKVLAFLLQH